MVSPSKHKVVSATLWSGTDIIVRQSAQFLFGIILARLLTPEIFGTVSLLHLFIGLAKVFIDGGFGSALIRQSNISEADKSTVFWINLFVGCLTAGGLVLSAPWIARFFYISELVPLIYSFSITLIASALGSIQFVLLTKNLNFKLLAKTGLISSSIGGIIAVCMAWLGQGIWALAAQSITASLISTLILWTGNTWRPQLVFDFDSVKKLFRFGGFMLCSSILDIVYNRLYSVLIGKFHGIAELGLYGRADSIKQLPASGLTGTFSRVAFPVLSEMAADRDALLRAARKAIRIIMLVNVSVMLGMLATAKPLVITLLGDQWTPAADILMILCFAGAMWPLHVINLNLLIAQGYSNLMFRLEIIKKIIGLTLILAGSYWGIFGIAWSQVLFGIIGFFINAYYTKTHLGYGVAAQTMEFLPGGFVGIGMALIVFLLGKLLWFMDAPVLWSIQIMAGVICFIAGCHLFGVRAYNEAIEFISFRSLSLPQSKSGIR